MNVKARHLAVLHTDQASLIAWASNGIWQHQEWVTENGVRLYVNIDGVELIPGRWYHRDETDAEAYGPFDTQLQAAQSLERYVIQVLKGTGHLLFPRLRRLL